MPLGDRDEHRRAHHAAQRVAPADQRLGRGDLQAGGIDLGLVEELELLALDGLAQFAQQLGAFLHVDDDLGIEYRQAGAPALLDRTRRGAGMRDDHRARAVQRIRRQADRSREHERIHPADVVGTGRRSHHRRGQLAPVFELALEHDHDLVAPQPHGADLARRGGVQAGREALQQHVARLVAEGFVDAAEAVQVHEQNAQGVLLAVGPQHGFVERQVEGLARQQSGPAVERGGVELGAGRCKRTLEPDRALAQAPPQRPAPRAKAASTATARRSRSGSIRSGLMTGVIGAPLQRLSRAHAVRRSTFKSGVPARETLRCVADRRADRPFACRRRCRMGRAGQCGIRRPRTPDASCQGRGGTVDGK